MKDKSIYNEQHVWRHEQECSETQHLPTTSQFIFRTKYKKHVPKSESVEKKWLHPPKSDEK